MTSLDLSQTEYMLNLANRARSIDYDARSKALEGQCNNTE